MHMFSAEKRLKRFSYTVSAVVLVLATPLAAGVIVKSSGPSKDEFPVGTKVKDTDRIVLKELDQVTILNMSGAHELRGPGSFRAGARGATKRTTFAKLTRQDARAQVRHGGTRAVGSDGETIPNLWFVDVTRSGTMCHPDLGKVFLWRPSTKTKQTYVMRSGTSDYRLHVTFGEESTVQRLDNERLQLEEAVEYMISGPGEAAAVKVSFIVIDALPEDAESMADLLIDKGCSKQLDILAKTLATPSPKSGQSVIE